VTREEAQWNANSPARGNAGKLFAVEGRGHEPREAGACAARI
jgi:hypothetical protein